MSTERDMTTGTTGEATGTAASAAGGSADTTAGGSAGATLNAEELTQKLREAEQRAAEAERKNQQLLSEKSNVEREREALRQREAMQRTGQVPPTPGTFATPYDEEIAALTQSGFELQNALAADPSNPVLRANAASIATQLRSSTRERERHMQELRLAEMRRELMQVPEALRMKVAERLDSGEYTSVKAAREAVEGVGASGAVEELRKQLAAQQEEIKRLRDIGPVADVNASILSAGGSSGGAREVTPDEWRRMHDDDASAARADADYESGKIRVVRK